MNFKKKLAIGTSVFAATTLALHAYNKYIKIKFLREGNEKWKKQSVYYVH